MVAPLLVGQTPGLTSRHVRWLGAHGESGTPRAWSGAREPGASLCRRLLLPLSILATPPLDATLSPGRREDSTQAGPLPRAAKPTWARLGHGHELPSHSRGDAGPGAACLSAAGPPGAGCGAGPESEAKVLQPWDLRLQVHAVAPSFQSDPRECEAGFCGLPGLGATWGHLSRGGWPVWQRPPARGQDSRPVCGNARGSPASSGVPLRGPASPRPPSHGARGSHEVCALSLRGGCMSKGGHEKKKAQKARKWLLLSPLLLLVSLSPTPLRAEPPGGSQPRWEPWGCQAACTLWGPLLHPSTLLRGPLRVQTCLVALRLPTQPRGEERRWLLRGGAPLALLTSDGNTRACSHVDTSIHTNRHLRASPPDLDRRGGSLAFSKANSTMVPFHLEPSGAGRDIITWVVVVVTIHLRKVSTRKKKKSNGGQWLQIAEATGPLGPFPVQTCFLVCKNDLLLICDRNYNYAITMSTSWNTVRTGSTVRRCLLPPPRPRWRLAHPGPGRVHRPGPAACASEVWPECAADTRAALRGLLCCRPPSMCPCLTLPPGRGLEHHTVLLRVGVHRPDPRLCLPPPCRPGPSTLSRPNALLLPLGVRVRGWQRPAPQLCSPANG